MCACGPDFTCEKCEGTPQDPWYFIEEIVPLDPAEQDKLLARWAEQLGEWK